MTKKALLGSLFIALAAVVSCNKETPAEKVVGTYNGSFSGTWQGNDTLVQSPNYSILITEKSDNKVTVSGSLFNDFDVLITLSGINVEPVSDDPELPQFLYSGDDGTLDFDRIENGNVAYFTGIKN